MDVRPSARAWTACGTRLLKKIKSIWGSGRRFPEITIAFGGDMLYPIKYHCGETLLPQEKRVCSFTNSRKKAWG